VKHLALGSKVFSVGLACFDAVTTVGFRHKAIFTGGKNLNGMLRAGVTSYSKT
jgi:hypothetical protein